MDVIIKIKFESFWEIGSFNATGVIIIMQNELRSIGLINIMESGGVMDRGLDIARNLRIVEILKSELLEDITVLYRHLADPVMEDTREVAAESLSDMIVIAYLLGKRLGVDYATMDRHISKKIRLGLINENEIEKYFGDLSELSRMRSGETKGA